MEKFLQNVQAMNTANEAIMHQPLGSKLAAYSNRLIKEFQEGLKTVTRRSNDYYMPDETDYAPGEEDRLQEWVEAIPAASARVVQPFALRPLRGLRATA